MFKPNSIILYVSDVEKSTRFYTRLLNAEPVEQYSEFSVFALSDDMILGLQAKSGIDPAHNHILAVRKYACQISVTGKLMRFFANGVNWMRRLL
ncbi:TPA: VOC family protein [Morganella morganii]